MRLSKQSIRSLCVNTDTPMIHPFEPEKVRVQGVSKGLSHASYDASIAHDLVLGRHPGYVIKDWAMETLSVLIDAGPTPDRPLWWLPRIKKTVQVVYTLLGDLGTLAKRLRDEPPAYALAHTVEDFHMPDNVGGDVADKSTFARVFVSAYNTFFDPGFHGNATLELVNDSDQRVEYKAGQGVCQFIFTYLDEATEEPYSGKYQSQAKRPQPAIFEPDSQGWPKATAPITPEADGEGVRTVQYKPNGDGRTRAEYQADKDRQRRHGSPRLFTVERPEADFAPAGLQAMLDQGRAQEAAETTLKRLGWTWAGGVEWKPPLGKPPAYVDEGLAATVEEWVQRGGVPFVQGLYDSMRGDQPERMRQRNKELYGERWGGTTQAPAPAPVAATATQTPQASDMSRYRWGEKPAALDKYAGQPDHAIRGWEPK